MKNSQFSWLRSALPLVMALLTAGSLASLLVFMAESSLAQRDARRPSPQRIEEAIKAIKRAKSSKSRDAAAVPVYIFDIDLARTPLLKAGEKRYAVLGLGQDAETGKQIVWIRSISENRIDGFPRGAAVFGDKAVKIASIEPKAVRFRNHGRLTSLALPHP